MDAIGAMNDLSPASPRSCPPRVGRRRAAVAVKRSRRRDHVPVIALFDLRRAGAYLVCRRSRATSGTIPRPARSPTGSSPPSSTSTPSSSAWRRATRSGTRPSSASIFGAVEPLTRLRGMMVLALPRPASPTGSARRPRFLPQRHLAPRRCARERGASGARTVRAAARDRLLGRLCAHQALPRTGRLALRRRQPCSAPAGHPARAPHAARAGRSSGGARWACSKASTRAPSTSLPALLELNPGETSVAHAHGGDEVVYALEGVLHVRAFGEEGISVSELEPRRCRLTFRRASRMSTAATARLPRERSSASHLPTRHERARSASTSAAPDIAAGVVDTESGTVRGPLRARHAAGARGARRPTIAMRLA